MTRSEMLKLSDKELEEISLQKRQRKDGKGIATGDAQIAQQILFERSHYLVDGEINNREYTADENYSYKN